MKNPLNTFFSATIVLLAVLSFSTAQEVAAEFNYTNYSVPYTVAGTPVTECSDGVDNADPEDALADTQDPGCHSDGNAANPASYVPADTSETNTPVSSPSGSLTANDCTIVSGASSCSSSVSWTTANLTIAATAITRNTGTPASFTPSPLAAGSQGVTLAYGATTFYLYHNAVLLAQDGGSASCAGGTTWDGDSCETSGGSVSASLSAFPISITAGDSSTLTWSSTNATSCAGTNFSTGASSSPSGNTSTSPISTTLYTVTCTGPGGSAQDSVTVSVTVGDPECSDGEDNDRDGFTDYDGKFPDPDCSGPLDDSEDGGGGGGPECSDGIDNLDTEDTLADALDPGCHTDGDANNPASYDPGDSDESNRRKPIYIEF